MRALFIRIIKSRMTYLFILFLAWSYFLYWFRSNYYLQLPFTIKFRPLIERTVKSPVIEKPEVIKQELIPTPITKKRSNAKEAIYIYFGEDKTAYAIARAESGMNCKSISSTSDYGLFQIHLPLHQWRFDRFGGKWDNCWDNARVAYEIYKEQKNKWKAWSVWNNGAYLAFME